MSIWNVIGRQFSHPSGLPGRLMGLFMRLINTKPNQAAIEALGIQPSDIVLELGFGPGHGLKLISRRFPLAKLHGVEKSQTMILQAFRRNKKLIHEGLLILHEGDFSALPLPAQSVNKILAVNIVYFWRDWGAVTAECLRVLQPGGRISIYATDAQTMTHWKFAGPDTHVLYTASELKSRLEQAGFRNCAAISADIMPGIKGIIATGEKPMYS